MKELLEKLKEIETLVELSIGTTMTEEKATDIYAVTNDLMGKVKKLNIPVFGGSSFDWDKFANALKDEFGESLVEEDGSEEDAYNWWLTDVTVTDIVEFIKNCH